MSYRRIWIVVSIMILGLAMFIPFAQAERQEFEVLECGATTYHPVHFSPDVLISSYDRKTIFYSTHESKLFDSWTGHVVGVVKKIDGKLSVHSFSKRMAPDGDFIISEIYEDSEGEVTTKNIYATGKWKGITGGAKGKAVTMGKPIVPGTAQSCYKYTGWFELPK
jgi:hypothetical protein